MEVIAHIHTEFPQKFGIPRQSGLVPELRGRVVFTPEYAREEAVRGLEGFSHIWLLWQFEDIERGASGAGGEDGEGGEGGTPRPWQPMVRPPILGGNKQMGVFATRSPFRPNGLGLSCVALDCIEHAACGPVLHVRGADLRDATPIYDIKPYLPRTDCRPEATGGFTDANAWQRLNVECAPDLLERVPAHARAALLGVLAEDPRPARQRSVHGKRYTLAFAGFDIRFAVEAATLTVISIDPR